MSICLRCMCMNKLCGALLCWDQLVGTQGCNHFVSVVGSVRVCSGMEGADASSKSGLAKTKD